MKFAISHLTRYKYGTPVLESVNEIRLTPSTDHRQSCYQHSIRIEPNVSLLSYEDFFGNRVHSFSVAAPHRQLEIKTQSIVVTEESEKPRNLELLLKNQLEIMRSDKFVNRHAEFLMDTNYTYLDADTVRQFLLHGPEASIHEQLEMICEAIYMYFEYDPYATQVNTTLTETYRLKRGVCQDFAHLMIAVCKSIGIPMRYVSGYHFVGDLQGGDADYKQASHAWVEAFVPGDGWIGFDPTNNCRMNWRYVKLGHGRDYGDIVPVKGIYYGSNQQNLEVEVDVKRIDE